MNYKNALATQITVESKAFLGMLPYSTISRGKYVIDEAKGFVPNKRYCLPTWDPKGRFRTPPEAREQSCYVPCSLRQPCVV